MEENRTHENKMIEVCDCDYVGQYRLYHLFNRFAEIATQDAEKLGMWKPDMYHRYGWVVAKQTLKLKEPICVNDQICISTLIAKGSFVAFPRYYFIEKEGKVIGECSSLWTLIDIENRRIIAPKRIGVNVPDIQHNIKLDTPQTIAIDLTMEYQGQRQVLYSDVDINQHMNNTRYIQWAFDILDYQIHQDAFVSEISINYKKEIRPLEYVELYLGHDKQRYIIEGRQKDEVYFSIEILFQKK